MNQKVLILGGCGRIGNNVAGDLLKYTESTVIVTSRRLNGESVGGIGSVGEGGRKEFLQLDLADRDRLCQVIRSCDLVVHCAGPFDYRDAFVLQSCIELGVNYLDVSDRPPFVKKALTYREAAQKAGVTAILSTGVFPGISNSMVRQGVESLDRAEAIYLYYVVAGSGGAGVTVMRTTFLGLQHPFQAWIEGEWREVLPYSDRILADFPDPYGKVGVYWFEVAETYSFVESFPGVKTVVTKFGSFPDFYNHLTWLTARFMPPAWLSNSIEFLSQTAYKMTEFTDTFSGVGVAMTAKIQGIKQGKKATAFVRFVHPHTATAAGYGTGSVARSLLMGELKKPGVWSVEQAFPTAIFQREMRKRNMAIEVQITNL
ncbi:MAG: saccharopine dehydrogenase NADP-binding domain-containing protein [Cyanobacteria bacterium SBLK]|nr:saccharopine dehydrogenase NADP-binding domain-containing protein [Cyanobacteria bacterium SBLK]